MSINESGLFFSFLIPTIANSNDQVRTTRSLGFGNSVTHHWHMNTQSRISTLVAKTDEEHVHNTGKFRLVFAPEHWSCFQWFKVLLQKFQEGWWRPVHENLCNIWNKLSHAGKPNTIMGKKRNLVWSFINIEDREITKIESKDNCNNARRNKREEKLTKLPTQSPNQCLVAL